MHTQRTENIIQPKNIHTNVRAALFIITKKWKQPKCPWTYKQNANSLYSEPSLKHKQEWSIIATCYNMGEPWKHCAKWKEPHTQGHILYDSLSIVQKRYMHRDRREVGDCQEQEKMALGLTANRYGVSLGSDANALKLDCDGHTTWPIYCTLLDDKMMKLTLYELQLKKSNIPTWGSQLC